MADEKKAVQKVKEEEQAKQADILTSQYDNTLPGQGRNPQVRLAMTQENVQCVNLLYLLYEGNFISRTNLRELIEILNKPRPTEGIAQYLINEAWLA